MTRKEHDAFTGRLIKALHGALSTRQYNDARVIAATLAKEFDVPTPAE